MDFIGNASNDPAPFFLYVPFSHVHTPQYAKAGGKFKKPSVGNFLDSVCSFTRTTHPHGA